MAIEQYANGFATTLAGAITDIATTLTLTGATGAPAAPFRLLIGSEILLVGARTGTACSAITRGAEGTTAAAHADLAPTTHILTRSSLLALAATLNQRGTVAATPSPTQEGNLYWPTDGFSVYRDTGAALEPWGPLTRFTDPAVAAPTTWLNQGTSTITSVNGGVHLRAVGSGATTINLVGRYKTAPATPYAITAFALFHAPVKQYLAWGLFYRESSSGKVGTFVAGCDSAAGAKTLTVRHQKLTNATTYAADYTGERPVAAYPGWMRIADDGTNRTHWLSADGVNWLPYFTVARTDFLTADQVGFGVITQNNAVPNLDALLTLLSWRET